MFAFFASDMAFGKAGHADAQIASFANELDELVRVLEAARSNLEFSAARWIAAQGQNISHPQGADLAEQLAYLLARRADAGKVGHSGQAVFPLDAIDDHQSLFARAASRPVGDRAIIGFALQQGRQSLFQQGPVAFGRFGREKLEGNHRLAGGALRGVDVSHKLHTE